MSPVDLLSEQPRDLFCPPTHKPPPPWLSGAAGVVEAWSGAVGVVEAWSGAAGVVEAWSGNEARRRSAAVAVEAR